jgi:hypothetical protein
VVLIFWGCAVLTVIFTGLAVSVSRHFLWPAAFTSWVFSFLGSWSIGLYTLVSTFALLTLALFHTFGWLRRPAQAVAAVTLGVVAWAVLHRTVDDYWLFFPIGYLFDHAFS